MRVFSSRNSSYNHLYACPPTKVRYLIGKKNEHDSYIHPEYGLKLKNEELPHASYHLIPGVGHFTPLAATKEFIAILTQHLNHT
ncbi:alpha/beta fold hydrolase [Bacillus sp. DJP31]|uniref:alpha/beta fold hydrolase n=1 Tax=Bacillus sp. DJP31 TaxID=3409789 RepID=UPI003BB6CE14